MSTRLILALVTAAGLLAAPACGTDDGGEPPTGIADACNPLGGELCLAPWPSSVYLVPADTETGVQLALPVEAMPVNIDDIPIDTALYNRWDGFSPTGPIVAAFPGGVSADGLPPHTDPGQSLMPDSPVVVLNMDTGERALVFAEIDMNVTDPAKRPLIIRPLERLAEGTRYAVAVRKSVVGADGAPLPIPAGFQAILDGAAADFDHPRMADVAGRYDDIFAALEADGVPRGDLVLAWDYVTASDSFLTSDLRSMRDQAMPVIGENGVNLTFDATEFAGDPALVYAALSGTHQAPNFLTAGEDDESVMNRGADGLPALDGMYDANFAIIVPRCVETAPLPIPVIVFGHGLFGSGAGYLDDDFLQEVAADKCFVVAAGDFIGLTERQIAVAAFTANNLNRAPQMTEKLAQSIINFIALEQIVRGPLADDPRLQFQGQRVIDADQVFYLGGSLGGIMGGVFMAYDPNITIGTLGVPGGAWALLFERSVAWTALQAAANASYRDTQLGEILIALLGMNLEPYDPITTARRVLVDNDPLLGVPGKQLLLYEAIGDCLVTNLSTEMLARTMGLQITSPSLRVPFGFTETTEPLRSGFTIYDEMPDPLPPLDNVPPREDNGTHSGVNENPAILRQLEHFVFTGEVIHTCEVDGVPSVCDCTLGACN